MQHTKTTFLIFLAGLALFLAPHAANAAPPTSRLMLWVKADDLNALNDGDRVERWHDASGQERDLTASGDARPTYRADGMFGRPAVVFVGDGKIVRYSLKGTTLSTAVLPATETETATFEPGEAAVYLFLPASKKDAIPPAIRLSTPLPSSTVGSEVAVTARATDNARLARVEFFVDGQLMQTISATPERKDFTWKWDTKSTPTGAWHSVSATAYDASSNHNEARAMVRVATAKR
jgi:hypothetical protein